MSIDSVYSPSVEPYYRYFIDNGYTYFGHGYMHAIFEKDGIIYKILRSSFGLDLNKSRFQFESDMLQLVANVGVPVASVVHIYGPGELVPNYCVLAEKRIYGNNYSVEDLTTNHVSAMMSVFKLAHNIKLNFFGPISDTKLQVDTWQEYLEHLVMKAREVQKLFEIDIDIDSAIKYFANKYRYTDNARFLILDPNEKNYIFNANDKLAGVIDIDHPIAFDPLYDAASFLYARPKIFNMMRQIGAVNDNDMETIKNYAIIYMLYDLWFRYEKNNYQINKRVEYYINKAKMFSESIKEIL